RCATCSAALRHTGNDQALTCSVCGREAPDYRCPECGDTRLRAVVGGARRTAEELGRAFPGTPVRTSGGDAVLDTVPCKPALVAAMPAAQTRADDRDAPAVV